MTPPALARRHPRRCRPESANNAGAQTSFIPMLTLGIPPNAVMALMVGAMTIKGIQPGPQVMSSNPELFWGLIASMWVGNLMLVVLNLPLIGIWIKLLTVPYRFLFPAIVVFCCIGTYAEQQQLRCLPDGRVCCGRLRLLQAQLRGSPAATRLHPRAHDGGDLRRALLLARGDWTTFVTRPLSAGLLLAAAAMVLVVMLPSIPQPSREEAFHED